MADETEIIGYIKYQLDQLASKNAHHGFEQLCRHLVRVRICSNVLPATGPVSAGGDQGRDFETFTTYLHSTLISNSTFVGKVTHKPIVFACSIQQNGIFNKIKSDIDTIMSGGMPVEAINYFCTSDVSIAKRHELQSWTKQKYDITLEIFDGQAIAELLADREVFWIAQKFLDVPSEMYPRFKDEDNWYQDLFSAWQSKKRPNLTFADFYEIKIAVRHATFSSDVKQDLPLWISLLQHFLSKAAPRDLRRKAIYEIGVASLRGLGTLLSQEEQIREYFSEINNLDEISDLEDTANALNYCTGAVSRNLLQITPNEIESWRQTLTNKVDKMLKDASTPGSKSPLLELRGLLSLVADAQKLGHINPEEAIKWWTQLTITVKDAPLFPLERFVDRLTKFTIFLGDHPSFEHLTQQVDLLLQERYGNIKAAEKCRDRALAFYEKGSKLKAIKQLHQAKIKWFTEETLEASTLSILLISECYRELGLSFAAKYYALGAAHVSLNPNKPELKKQISRSIIRAAECDYTQGCWCGFLELADLWIRLHGYFSQGSSKNEDEFSRFIFATTTIKVLTGKLDSRLDNLVEYWIKRWSIDNWLKDLLPVANEAWSKSSIPEVWKKLEEQLVDRPFNDLGPRREVRWCELGVTWKAEWSNDYDTTPAAEQFIALLQILLADMAEIDLCLLKTHIDLEVSVEDGEPKAEPIPSNKGRRWKVTLPKNSSYVDIVGLKDLQSSILAVAITVLEEATLLPDSRFFEILENCFRTGLQMRVFVAKPYEVLWREFIGKETFQSSNRQSRDIPQLSLTFELKESNELGWIDAPGPTYSKEQAIEMLRNRYEQSSIPIKYTLQILKKDKEFRLTVERLRTEGWLNWHILCSIANLAVNYRVQKVFGASNNPILWMTWFQIFMKDPETAFSSTVPLSEFTEDKMRFQHNAMLTSSLVNYGLELHQKTPDFEAIAHFLKFRYNYYTDDIPHEDPFAVAMVE